MMVVITLWKNKYYLIKTSTALLIARGAVSFCFRGKRKKQKNTIPIPNYFVSLKVNLKTQNNE